MVHHFRSLKNTKAPMAATAMIAMMGTIDEDPLFFSCSNFTLAAQLFHQSFLTKLNRFLVFFTQSLPLNSSVSEFSSVARKKSPTLSSKLGISPGQELSLKSKAILLFLSLTLTDSSRFLKPSLRLQVQTLSTTSAGCLGSQSLKTMPATSSPEYGSAPAVLTANLYSSMPLVPASVAQICEYALLVIVSCVISIKQYVKASQVLVPDIGVLIMVDRLAYYYFFFVIGFRLAQAVLQLLGLAALDLHELALVLHCFRLEHLVEHRLNGLQFGVVLDLQAIENGVELDLTLEDVIVHTADAVHGCLELLVLALLQKFEGVLLLRRLSLHYYFKLLLMEFMIRTGMTMELMLFIER